MRLRRWAQKRGNGNAIVAFQDTDHPSDRGQCAVPRPPPDLEHGRFACRVVSCRAQPASLFLVYLVYEHAWWRASCQISATGAMRNSTSDVVRVTHAGDLGSCSTYLHRLLKPHLSGGGTEIQTAHQLSKDGASTPVPTILTAPLLACMR